MEQKVTRSENPVARAGAAISKAMESLGNMASQSTAPRTPGPAQALAQALTQPMGDEPKQQQQPTVAPQPVPFQFDWPGARAHVMEQVKAELAVLENSPFVDPDFPRLTVALLFKVATELAVLNKHLAPKGKAQKSPIIRP